MNIKETKLQGLFIIEPTVLEDERGFFFESYNEKKFIEATGKKVSFVQDNHSQSIRGVLRGMHFQKAPHSQGKLVRCIRGEVYDVAVDIRPSSRTFGQWIGIVLSAENKTQLWIPEGFAHGFLTLSDIAEFSYKTTNFYNPGSEGCIIWNDEDLNITWPLDCEPVISCKDQQGDKWASFIINRK